MADPGTTASDNQRHMFSSFFSIIKLVFILLACVELADASTVVDVYRLIQYDISDSPFGSRLASLSHHAASSLFAPGSDLSRAVLLLPLREFNESFIREYIEQGKPLGGLLVLLPKFFRSESSQTIVGHADNHDKEKMKELLAGLEQKLIHSTIQYPVYFAFEDENLDEVLADIKRNDAAGQPVTATTGGPFCLMYQVIYAQVRTTLPHATTCFVRRSLAVNATHTDPSLSRPYKNQSVAAGTAIPPNLVCENESSDLAHSCCNIWNGSPWIRHLWGSWFQTHQSILQRGLEYSFSLPFSSYCCNGWCSYSYKSQYYLEARLEEERKAREELQQQFHEFMKN